MTTLTAKPLTAKPLTARPLTAYRLGESTDGANPLVWSALVANSSGVLVDQLTGVGTPTWSHTASLLLPDWEGIYRTIPAGTSPITGARKVTNLAAYSEDISNAAWFVANGAAKDGIDGIVFSGGATETCIQSYNASSVAGKTFVLSATVWVDSGTLDFALRQIQQGVAAATSSDITATTTPKRVSFTRTNGAGASTIQSFGVYTSSGADAGTLRITNIQLEDVTSQSNQNPSEYVPTTTAAASKFFNYENGNQVTSNVVTEAKGDPLTDWWFQCQPAKTNKALYSNDASNAAWVKTNMTGAKDAVGLDGAPNTGSTLTATSANATAIQTVTSASANHVARFFLRRKTGTGTVNICCDGSTWTEAVLTADYQEFMVLANTTNPQIGVQIVTSGDAVEMGNGEVYS